MPISEEQTKAIGMGIAGFILSLSTIMVLAKGKALDSNHVDAIIADSRKYLKGPASLVGNQDTLLAAEEALQGAERFLHLFLSRAAPSA